MSAALLWQLGKLAASLVAIVLVAALARKLRLGGDVRLGSDEQACAEARAAVAGFEPVECVRDRAGIGALLRDAGGRVMLLRRHGAHFAARVLDSHVSARLDRNLLTIGPGERHFGAVTLDLGAQAQVWAGSLRRLDGGGGR